MDDALNIPGDWKIIILTSHQANTAPPFNQIKDGGTSGYTGTGCQFVYFN